MPDILTKKDLDTLEILLTYDSASSMYAMLQSKGYKYAVLADGVVRDNSLSGAAADHFMRVTARGEGIAISDDIVEFIYRRMARGYLDALTAQYKAQGMVNRDISHREAWDFHSQSFAAFGLSPDAWTLNSVFAIMANDTVRERYWSEILAAAGDPVSEAIVLVRTESFMATASVVGSQDVKKVVQNWRDRLDTPAAIVATGKNAAGMVADRINAFFNEISESVLGQVPPGAIIPDWVPVPPPTPLPTPNMTTVLPSIPAAPNVPVSPAHKPRKRPRLPPPTTHQGHPGSGYGQSSSANTGPRLRLDP
ncbi:hypothetical protein ABDX87_13660 [Pseudomonas abietaniphila]|uniref:hypothetical protein n=1 Tax=Pseudomonas abietaniphila TaxID=89065 RepID=UPI003216CCEA